jgi:hypothetical protein
MSSQSACPYSARVIASSVKNPKTGFNMLTKLGGRALALSNDFAFCRQHTSG